MRPMLHGERLALAATRAQGYEVQLTPDLLTLEKAGRLRELVAGRRVLVCTTPTVERLYGARLKGLLAALDLQPAWLVLACPEPAKTMATALSICSTALAAGLDRKGLIVAFGGGVCSDLVTLAASLIRRGIAHLRIPTTLIGQIDAAVGLKGAVNLDGAKNFLGCFHPPAGVLVDPGFLRSLPDAAHRQGMAEIVKIACIRDRTLFELVQREGRALIASRFAAPADAAASVIERAISGMISELAENPYEDRSHARAVDFGHTVSPTLEAATGYGLHHGEAVAIDIAFSCTLGRLLGLLPAEKAGQVLALLLALGLPITHPLLDADLVDKAFASVTLHRGGALNLVVPTAIGASTFVERSAGIPSGAVAEAILQLDATAARASAGLAA